MDSGPLPALWLAGTTAALAAFLVARAWTPGDDPRNSLCFLHRVFGLSCPTCGLTRAFAELAKGHVRAAIRLHPLAPPLAVELGVAWVLAGVAIVRPGWPLPRRAALPALLATLASLAIVWVYRLATGTLPP